MRIAYLSSRLTLPGSPDRRGDAFEHDLMMDNLRPAFAAHGGVIDDIAWDDPDTDWSRYDAAMIGTAWDYQDRYETFLDTLDAIATKTRVFNSRQMVVWNSHKSYLRDLETRGVRVIPTLWLDTADRDSVETAFEKFAAEELIFKRQVGANSDGQFRIARKGPVPSMPEPMMVQPFFTAIEGEGELSFVFIGGHFSHAIIKQPAKGDYRIQSLYGGIEIEVQPKEADIREAAGALAALDETPLYGRVDMLRGEDGKLYLMELELIEPFLYPRQGPQLGENLFRALERMQ